MRDIVELIIHYVYVLSTEIDLEAFSIINVL